MLDAESAKLAFLQSSLNFRCSQTPGTQSRLFLRWRSLQRWLWLLWRAGAYPVSQIGRAVVGREQLPLVDQNNRNDRAADWVLGNDARFQYLRIIPSRMWPA